VYSQLTSEGESEVSEPVLTVEGHIELCLLLIIVVKSPSWRLAMNSVNQVWITVLSEWICYKLCLFSVGFSTGSESAFWITKSCESAQIVVPEINSKKQLRLQVSW